MGRIDWAEAPHGAEFYAERRYCKVAGIRVLFYKDSYGWTKSPLTIEQCIEAKDYDKRPSEWPEEERINQIGVNGGEALHYDTVTIDNVVYRHNENGMYALYLKTKNGTWAESAKVTNEDLKMEENKPVNSFLVCDDCGKQDDSVSPGLCPYAQEINDTEIECNLCPDCYHERCMDI